MSLSIEPLVESAMNTPWQDLPWSFGETVQVGNGTVDFVVLVDLLVALSVLTLYFVPTFIAHVRDVRAYAKIFFINVLLGWTVIGWIVALIWSLRAKPFFGRKNRRNRGRLQVAVDYRLKKPYYDLREEDVVELENEQLEIGKT
jgi:hypothetical protein